MFYYNFVNLCNKKGVSPSSAAEAMGIHKSQVTRWAKTGSMPRQSNLQKMMDYFGCSLEDLIGDNGFALTSDDKKSVPAVARTLTDSQIQLLNLLPDLTEDDLDDLLLLARSKASRHKVQDDSE